MSTDFSVIIPTFRRPEPLREAIASALGQAEVSVEVIVVDDSPEASARRVVEAFGGRARYLKNPAPSGGRPSIVRNLAWPQAQGEFIHFLDDDDIVPEGHYAAVKKIFSGHPEVGVVFGRIAPFGSGPEDQLRRERAFFDGAARRARLCRLFGRRWGFVACLLFRKTLLMTSAGVVRRACVEQVGGFDPRICLGEGTAFYVLAMRQCGTWYMDRVALHFRISNPSLMHAAVPDPAEAAQLALARKLSKDRYRGRWGAFEFFALKVLAFTVLRGHEWLIRDRGGKRKKD
jgi:glycosyltransferase involved in cell wall biosynthesis